MICLVLVNVKPICDIVERQTKGKREKLISFDDEYVRIACDLQIFTYESNDGLVGDEERKRESTLLCLKRNEAN